MNRLEIPSTGKEGDARNGERRGRALSNATGTGLASNANRPLSPQQRERPPSSPDGCDSLTIAGACALSVPVIHRLRFALARLIPHDPQVAFATESDMPKPISIRAIQAAVARRYKITVDEMLSFRGKRGALPCQVAMRLAAKLTEHTLAEIGRSFNRSDAAVRGAVNKIDGRAEVDPDLAAETAAIETELKSQP